MENWDVLVAKKTKQIWDEYTQETQGATDMSRIAAAISRRDERLEKVKALTVIENAAQMVLDAVQSVKEEPT